MADYSKGFDIKKLRGMTKDLTKKAGQGGDLFFYANKIDGEIDVRILPSPAIGNGSYFVEQDVWWINGKTYLSNSTELIGGVDVIQEEVDKARASGDKDVIALLDKRNDKNAPVVSKEFRPLIPILELKAEYDDDDELIKCDVVDYRVLVAKPTQLTAIHAIFCSRPMQNKTPWGMADREKGYNMILTKTGTGTSTRYGAMGWNEPMEIDEKWYDEKKMPNVFEITQKAAKSDAYLRSVIRNYLYGEDIIADDSKKDESKDAAAPKTEAKKHTRPRVDKAQTAASDTGRNLVDDAASGTDDNDIDDL